MRRSDSLRGRKKLVRLLSDECIPELINRFLEAHSIKIAHVADLGLISQPDEIIFQKAKSLKIPILTLDVRFVGQMYQEIALQFGVILLRYKGQQISKALLKSLEKFIASEDMENLKNTIVVIDEQKYRVNRKLSSN